MMSYQITSTALGGALGLAILLLVRRDHLKPGLALFWLAFAAASIVFGAAPTLSDRIATALGISYGPTLVLLIALAALVLHSVQADIRATRSERELRRLTQRLAMLEADLSAAAVDARLAEKP